VELVRLMDDFAQSALAEPETLLLENLFLLLPVSMEWMVDDDEREWLFWTMWRSRKHVQERQWLPVELPST
jgi:hypothetical protein